MALADQADREKLAHMIYGRVVKHFGLATTHTFSSWSLLREEERGKWIAASADLQAELEERKESPRLQRRDTGRRA